jgi:carboxypeptidase family protein
MACFARALVCIVMLGPASLVFAQTEGTIVGTVTDESKAVLPGVTVTATDANTGRPYVSVTDGRGAYRLTNVLAGTYKVQADLTGFAPVIISGLELLVGTNATVNITLKVASVSESLTVTGESPLVDVRSTAVAGNVDRRQMEELPLSGRNWLEMTLLVKGITANELSANKPAVAKDSDFALSLDGQQIQQAVAGSSSFSQPGLSREAIAEYQVATNLFDVTQGRSAGIQVQAISRSGTNTLAGNFYGYFRSDKFNAADFIAKRVLPYQNQQVGGSIGGPILKDKTHYFANLEIENEPATSLFQPPGYKSTIALPHPRHQYRFLTRGDHQFAPASNLSVRLSTFRDANPFGIQDGTTHPTRQSDQGFDSYSLQGTWTHVISNSFVQEVKVAMFHYHWNHTPAVGVPLTANYAFPGLAIGARSNYPEEFWQNTPSIRSDLNWHHGTHDVKFGGEWLHWRDSGWWLNVRRGVFTLSALPADIERRFPLEAWNDPSRWDLSGLDPIVVRYQQNYAEESGQETGKCPLSNGCGNWSLLVPRPYYSAWIADTWKASSRLTVNFGLRYDLDWGAVSPPFIEETSLRINNGFETLDAGYKNGIRDYTDFQPRAGFTYDVTGNNNFIIRGGSGLYYGVPTSELAFDEQLFDTQRVLVNQWVNDRLPGFITDPTRGVTSADIVSGKVPLLPQALYKIDNNYKMPATWQSIVGFQKQIGEALGVDSDLTYYSGFNQPSNRDPNNFYDPVSGYAKNPNVYGRPVPTIGQMNYRFSTAKSNNLSLASQITRRYRNHFQATVAYTHVFYRNDENSGNGGYSGTLNNTFCLSCEFGRAADAQRHTLRANGIIRLPGAFSLAGTYIFGTGQYYQSVYAQNPVGTGGTRLIPVRGASIGTLVGFDGSVVPRNDFEGQAIHKLDLRVTRDFSLGSGVKITGIAEMFNVFNHANYGAYNLTIGLATYGLPAQNQAPTYVPRSAQLAFKLSF